MADYGTLLYLHNKSVIDCQPTQHLITTTHTDTHNVSYRGTDSLDEQNYHQTIPTYLRVRVQKAMDCCTVSDCLPQRLDQFYFIRSPGVFAAVSFYRRLSSSFHRPDTWFQCRSIKPPCPATRNHSHSCSVDITIELDSKILPSFEVVPWCGLLRDPR